jgi:hypothetical protein
MGTLKVIRRLSQVTLEYLQICMPHQSLQRVDVHPVSQTFQREGASKVV